MFYPSQIKAAMQRPLLFASHCVIQICMSFIFVFARTSLRGRGNA
ncbi:hypothetical protein [Candidatus Protochlamydia naegleriophila]|nr:hypothetical protein [Candidatus Protochlamydia naegleriophila]